jgi:hypothetical protein
MKKVYELKVRIYGKTEGDRKFRPIYVSKQISEAMAKLPDNDLCDIIDLEVKSRRNIREVGSYMSNATIKEGLELDGVTFWSEEERDIKRSEETELEKALA